MRGQRNRLKKPLRLSLRRSFDRAMPMCFSTALTLMLSCSAISRFFSPAFRLSKKTRRHCSAVVDLVPKPRKVELPFAAVGDQAADISVERIESAGAFAVRLAAAETIDAPVPYGRHQVGQHRTREVDLLPPFPQHQEDVLHDIFGEFAVVDQPESPDAQRFVMRQKELPEIGRMSVQVLHFFKSGRSGRPQFSESIFKYTKTRSHTDGFFYFKNFNFR